MNVIQMKEFMKINLPNISEKLNPKSVKRRLAFLTYQSFHNILFYANIIVISFRMSNTFQCGLYLLVIGADVK